MADDLLQGGGATASPGTPRSLAELTPADNIAISVRVAKPQWMETRFPVSMETYQQLVREAEQADPGALTAEADETLVEDPSVEIATAGPTTGTVTYEDLPEDQPGTAQQQAAPGAGAPVTAASFEATPQTGFRPPDCTLAVGPSDVLVAVNVDLAGYRKDGSLRFRWPSMTALFST
ncbi:MAG: hypothetical protein ACRDTT_14660, partial [Pseudonocardiaceae bacterium]